jgi:MFS transporter, FHS family, glucose/mannose:H+ symporter
MRAEPAPHARMRAYLLLTGALVFIYVGTESAIGGWIAAYAQRLDATGQSYWALTSSLFWGGLLASRAAASLFLRFTNEVWLVLFSLMAAVAGNMMILMGEDMLTISAGAGLTGFGLAAVFPTTFAIFTQRLGAQAARIAGMFFVMANIGGAIIPWLVGLASNHYGDLRVGLIVPLLGISIMIALQGAIALNLSTTRRLKLS